MAKTVEARARRGLQLGPLDAFLWLVRIAAILVVVWGSYQSLSSGRLTGAAWRSLVVIGLAQGAIYGLIALGYTMVYGILRFINFAHGEVFMAGAMVGFYVADALNRAGIWASQPLLGVLIVLLASMITSAVIAFTLERVAYRPLRGTPRLIPFITAIGASFFLQYAFAGLVGTDVKSYPGQPLFQGRVTIFGVSFLKSQLVVIGGAIVMMIGLYLLVERTRVGRAMRAVSEDQEIASLMGVNVDRTISIVFIVGGAMAGAAALFYTAMFPQVHFRTGFLPGIKAFTAAVLGGIGNIPGAMLGGLTLGMVESLGPSLILTGLGVPSAHQLKDVVAFLTLVLVLIFRPTGILGERLAEERG